MSEIVLRPSSATLRYDEMCRAIAAAYEVDEVKDIRDKALAIETYAAQAKNVEAERQACEIRLRAERRAGQLLASMPKAKREPDETGQGSQRATSDRTLADLGISKPQSSRWQKLAAIPEDEFEATFAKRGKPPLRVSSPPDGRSGAMPIPTPCGTTGGDLTSCCQHLRVLTPAAVSPAGTHQRAGALFTGAPVLLGCGVPRATIQFGRTAPRSEPVGVAASPR